MFKIFIQFILLSIFLNFSAYSKNYEKIIINGNERISNETILVFSEIQDNITLDENSINEILKKLYKSGFFKDVSVKIKNDNLIIEVLENPIIQTVFIEGIKKKRLKNLYMKFYL
ncbi:POTRA domain-containing protein [Candidatus Pelagibacter giovannonii]|uniref:POTRA domain-containing protein n=1 Tax=Candidatus Pelagibacter giovannonii TaxID=2563896 RepID=UPI001E534E30|nr:POTRA domain-containing protein [Candidatus Pelagibacter giovannonii]